MESDEPSTSSREIVHPTQASVALPFLSESWVYDFFFFQFFSKQCTTLINKIVTTLTFIVYLFTMCLKSMFKSKNML
jgi:hypothetical protein